MDPLVEAFIRLKIAYAYFKTSGYVDYYALRDRYAFLKGQRKFGEKG
jgi:hypothetical protein